MVILLLLVAVVAVVGAPLRPGRGKVMAPDDGTAALEAAKDSKLREIRDAELDFRTGKLSKEDHRALDRTLRAEAIDILKALDATRGKASDEPAGGA